MTRKRKQSKKQQAGSIACSEVGETRRSSQFITQTSSSASALAREVEEEEAHWSWEEAVPRSLSSSAC